MSTTSSHSRGSPLVMKFGGTSVGDAANMRQVATLVTRELARAPLVVLSAMAKVTDELFAMARVASAGDPGAVSDLKRRLEERHRVCATELFAGGIPDSLTRGFAALIAELDAGIANIAAKKTLDPRAQDAVVGLGERFSTLVFSHYLRHLGLDAELLDARDVMVTDDAFGSALPQRDSIRARAQEKLAPKLLAGRAVVTQGYIGRTERGESTTLGRGGSDFSAALFGAAVDAVEIQIWTDVEGVMSADPRVVKAARPVAVLSASEAGELAAFGAKVLHPATIHPAVEARIPVTVRHTLRPDGRFTTITSEAASGRSVAAIASRGPITVLTVASPRMLNQSGFLARLFDVFARRRVSVDVVATAELSVSLTVESDAPLASLMAEIETFANVKASEGRALVAVVGERLKQTKGIGARVFSALADYELELISMGANEINLSIVVERSIERAVVERLHRVLIEEEVAA